MIITVSRQLEKKLNNHLGQIRLTKINISENGTNGEVLYASETLNIGCTSLIKGREKQERKVLGKIFGSDCTGGSR